MNFTPSSPSTPSKELITWSPTTLAAGPSVLLQKDMELKSQNLIIVHLLTWKYIVHDSVVVGSLQEIQGVCFTNTQIRIQQQTLDMDKIRI